MAGNWKVFGPTAEYSDGDAEFFRLTSQLSDQYEWFAPREQEPQQQPFGSPDEDEELLSTQRQGRVARPEFGMTPREIAALGLTGPQHGAPDPVRVAVFCVQRVRACACVLSSGALASVLSFQPRLLRSPALLQRTPVWSAHAHAKHHHSRPPHTRTHPR